MGNGGRIAPVDAAGKQYTRMDPRAMEPFGTALLAYFEGNTSDELLIRRDDGKESPIPVRFFFREPFEFTPLDNMATERCVGHVLDAGAGTGLHSLLLQTLGFPVTAIDVSPHAVDIMTRRGLKDVHCADIFAFQGRRFHQTLRLADGNAR